MQILCRSRKGWRGNKGFTLIETLVVLAMIGLMASMIAYAYSTTTDMAEYEGAALEMREMADLMEMQRLAGKTAGAVNAGWIASNWPEIATRMSNDAPWGSSYSFSNNAGVSVVRVNLPIDHPFSNGYNLMLDGDVTGNVLTITGSTSRHHGDILQQNVVERTLLYGDPVTW
ncbi:MAG: type II secretion system GspH family protein [Candidatus Thiodiazotropha lotti]|nr:type II secretion system GspH family protein [Candidatus Thiodiazotropha lotti]